jgi:hypothetical protein
VERLTFAVKEVAALAAAALGDEAAGAVDARRVELDKLHVAAHHKGIKAKQKKNGEKREIERD